MGYGSNSTSATIVLEELTSDLNPTHTITYTCIMHNLLSLLDADPQTGSGPSGGIIAVIVLVIVAIIGWIAVAILIAYFINKRRKSHKADL